MTRTTTAVAVGLILGAGVAGAQCPATPEAATCWTIDRAEVRIVASATAGGRSGRCTIRCEAPGGDAFLLRDDGTYAAPATLADAATFTCPADAGAVPPLEEGTVTRRRRKLVLTPADSPSFAAFLDACSGYDVDLRHYRTTLRGAPDGRALAGVTKLHFVTATRPPVATRVTVRFTATRAAGATAARARARKPLPPCAPDLPPRCRAAY